MLRFLNKIFRFFFPKDFWGEFQKGLVQGQEKAKQIKAKQIRAKKERRH